MTSPISFEPFTMIDSPMDISQVHPTTYPHQIFLDYKDLFPGRSIDLDILMTASLRRQYPNHTLTVVPSANVNLLAFASAGHATAIQDETEPTVSSRGFIAGYFRGQPGQVGEAVRYAKYHYLWDGVEFIIYRMRFGFVRIMYILCEPLSGEKPDSNSKITDELIKAVGEYQSKIEGYVYVFDRYWTKSRQLFEEVQKARWEDVILNEEMKTTLINVVGSFFDSKDVYDDLGIQWKRGIIYHGKPGNGKTLSIKAMMHTLANRPDPIPTLYVKSAPATYQLRNVFVLARRMAPCLLVLEDIDTIVNFYTRSYFFNEVDGLESNDGILMIASTNHLDALDPGLSKRPSRFDRKYLFPLPSMDERILYCQYWQNKLAKNPNIKFPDRLCAPIAALMDEFSFAYMKEAFVATLLVIAASRSAVSSSSSNNGGGGDDGGDDDLEKFELWREMVKQVKLLREDMDNSALVDSTQEISTTSTTTTRAAGNEHHDIGFADFQTPFSSSLPHDLSPIPLPHRQRPSSTLVGLEYEMRAPRAKELDEMTPLQGNIRLEKVVRK